MAITAGIKIMKKKPIPTETLEWTGDNVDEIKKFCGNKAVFDGGDLRLKTLEDEADTSHHVTVGDIIIKGEEGEVWAIKARIFKKTYEPAE